MRTGFWSIRMRTGLPKRNRTLEMIQLSSLRPTFRPAGSLSRYETRCLVTGNASHHWKRRLIPIRNTLSCHWKSRHSARSTDPSAAGLPALISASLWAAFLSLFHRDDFTPGPSESQILADRRGIKVYAVAVAPPPPPPPPPPLWLRRSEATLTGGSVATAPPHPSHASTGRRGHGLGAGGPGRLAVRAATAGRLGQAQAKAEICPDEGPFAVPTAPGAGRLFRRPDCAGRRTAGGLKTLSEEGWIRKGAPWALRRPDGAGRRGAGRPAVRMLGSFRCRDGAGRR